MDPQATTMKNDIDPSTIVPTKRLQNTLLCEPWANEANAEIAIDIEEQTVIRVSHSCHPK